MKMVLVYDTDNVEDYQNSIAIMRQLVNDYDEKSLGLSNHRQFGRIEFVKILREWERAAKNEPRSTGNPDIASLRSVKLFADNIWREKKEQ
jgi:hypothetical protein